MRQVYKRCAGLDVHKKTVVACRVRIAEQGDWEQEVRTFGTMTHELLQLVDWLLAWEVTHVALESTGEYWKPVYNLLEGNVTVLVVNAQHVKHVPGRKTDVQDAEWLAELLAHGLLKASFIPAKPQRDLRDLTRYRVTLVEERARVVNRVQKVLENANIKLASVATDVLGVSGRRMLEALVADKTDAATMAELAKGRLRNKLPLLQQALTGVVDAQHRFLIAQHLVHIDFLDEQIATVSDQIVQQIEGMPHAASRRPPADANRRHGGRVRRACPLTWQAAADILDTAPGVDQKAAYQVLAEMGINMRQFPTANHLGRLGRACPGQSAEWWETLFGALHRWQSPTADGHGAVRLGCRPHQRHLFGESLPSPRGAPRQETRHYCRCSLDVGQFLSYAFQTPALSRSWRRLFRPAQ